MKLDRYVSRFPVLRALRRSVPCMGIAALLGSVLAAPAIAGNYDGAMGRTRYVAMTGDYNGDGQNDVLMKAVPKLVSIPIDDDLMVPIPIPVPSPTFALLSTSYGNYTLVVNPGADVLGSPQWTAATQQIAYSGAAGAFAGSVTITASAGEQASFVVAMAADTGALQLAGTTAPAVDTTRPNTSSTPLAVNVAVPHLGNADAGTLPGALVVDESGAAVYSVDLVVPPATAGMFPALSLSYNSKGANGIAGLGWSLNGGASIQRCAKTIAQDGVFDRISFTNSDRLCMNGSRLLRIDGANPGTDMAARDAAYWAAGALYRTELETFARITRLANGGFKVEEKGGRIDYFGTDANSASQAQGRTDGKPMQWMLARTEDRSGNYLTWEYNVNPANGEVMPRQIRFSGNAGAGLAPDLAVRFDYEARPDAQGAFVGGSRNDMTMRLITIKTYTGTDSAGNGGTLARNYQVHYKDSSASGRSLVDWIQASALHPSTNALEYLPRTTFEWADTPAVPTPVTGAPIAWPYFEISPNSPKAREPVQVLARIDDSGRSSMVSVHMKACGMYNEGQCVDSDHGIMHATGRIGIRSPDGVVSEITVDFAPLRDVALGPLQMGISRKTPSYLQFGDVNGDGRDDILAVDFSGSDWYVDRYVWGVCLNDGVGVVHFTCIPGANTDPVMAELRADKKMHMISFDGLGNPGTDCFYNNATGKIECKPMAVTMENALPADLKRFNRENFFKPRGVNFGKTLTDFYALWKADVPAANPSSPYRSMWYYDMALGYGVWQPIDVIHGITACFFSEKGLNCKTVEQIRSVGPLMRDISAPQSLGDLNGDGLTDFMYIVRAAKPFPMGSMPSWEYVSGIQAPSDIRLCLSKETAVECSTQSKRFAPNADYSDPAETAQIDDFTGDGITRVLFDVTPNAPSLTGARSELCRLAAAGFVCQDVPYVPTSTMDDATKKMTIKNQRFDGGGAYFSHSGVATHFVKAPSKINGLQAWTPWQMAAPAAQDKLTRVVNGIGQVAEVAYARADDASVYSRLATIGNVLERPVYPQVLALPGVLVKEARRDNGKGGMRTSTYFYEGYMIDAEGRSSAGLGAVTETDADKQIATRSVYRRDFPFDGELVRTTVTARSGVVLSDMVVQPNKQEFAFGSGAKSYFVFTEASTTSRKDLNGSALGTVAVANQYTDGWGNLVRAQETTSAGGQAFSSVKVSAFKNDTANWLIGLPETVTLTKSDPVAGAIARTMDYEYDANGAVAREVAEKATLLQQEIRHERNRNKFGLIDRTVQAWTDPHTASVASRTLKDVEYDARGRFIVTSRNALGHRETAEYHAATGARRSVRDANQLTTSWTVNGFGRVQVELGPDGNETRSYLKACAGACPLGAAIASIVEHYKAGERSAAPAVRYSDSLGHPLRTLTWGFDGRELLADTRFDAYGRAEESDQVRFAGAAPVLSHKTVYDDLDRVIEVQTRDAGGGTVRSKTSYNGTEIVYTNALEVATTHTQDALGRVIRMKDGKGGVTAKTYDGFGNLLTTTNPNGNVVSIVYDRLGRRTDMLDPDLGMVHYDLDALGRTWKQSSARQRAAGQFTRMEYDALDRMTARFESDLESHWKYDSADKGVGRLAEAYTQTGAQKDYQRVHAYDGVGRRGATTELIGGTVYTSKPEYDSWGRLIRETHQRGLGKVKAFDFRYNDKGYLASVERGPLTLWKVIAQDAAQRPTEVRLGNGLVYKSVFDPYTARLDNNELRLAGALRLADAYKYDKLGNVLQRDQWWDAGGFSESFGYDELGRMTASTVSGQAAKAFVYDAAGNLKSKTGTGSGDYVYPPQGIGSVRPHSVQSIPGVGSFSYDANGNMESGAGRTTSWNSFDMPTRITRGQAWSGFTYGPEHQRTLQQTSGATVTAYAGAIEAEHNGSALTVKTYWPNGLGVEIERADGTVELNWVHKDKLGSPIAISDTGGALKERLAYDPWGKRRTPEGAATPDTLDGVVDKRGYTGHEMLDQLDLVHMNGRVYDPLLGRFMSADPVVTDPTNGQHYNRYSYVSNNPMGATDPTGFETHPGDVPIPTVSISGDRSDNPPSYRGFSESSQPYFGVVREGSSPTTGRGYSGRGERKPSSGPVKGGSIKPGSTVDPGSSPLQIDLSALNPDFNRSWSQSLPGGKAQEFGFTMAIDLSDSLVAFKPGGGGAGNFFPDFNIPTGFGLLGSFHTHPYSKTEGGHTDVSFSAGDIVNLVNSRRTMSVVQSGASQFLMLRTSQTQPSVTSANATAVYNYVITRSMQGGATFSAATQAASMSAAKQYGMAYYEGKGGIFVRKYP